MHCVYLESLQIGHHFNLSMTTELEEGHSNHHWLKIYSLFLKFLFLKEDAQLSYSIDTFRKAEDQHLLMREVFGTCISL